MSLLAVSVFLSESILTSIDGHFELFFGFLKNNYTYLETRYLLVLLFFILGLMAKPMLVTLPLVLLLLDYWPLNRLQRGTARSSSISPQRSSVFYLMWEKTPFLTFALASCMITFLAQQNEGAVGALDTYPLNVRIANAFVSYAKYLEKMILPFNLAPLYLHPGKIPVRQAVGACVVLLSISFLVIKAKRRHPYFVVGWLWYIVTLLPVIGLVQVGMQSMADRYTYMPLIGVFIIIAWGAPDLMERGRYREMVLSLFAGILLLCFMTCTWLQVTHWRNSITLFTHTANVTAHNYVAQYNLACGYAVENKREEAMYWLRKSIEHGNRNWDLIKTDTDLESIRGSSYYKELIKGH